MASRRTRFVRVNDGGNCNYCGRTVFREHEDKHHKASFDHDIPKCRGGSNALSNGILSCTFCNEAKADMTSKEFVHFCATGEFLPSYVEYLQDVLRKKLGHVEMTRILSHNALYDVVEKDDDDAVV